MADETPSVPPDAPPGEVVVATLDITVAGESMHIEIPVPTGPVTGAMMVPIARALAEAIGGRAVEVEAAAGRTVSCRKGCGACCRQLVPLPVAEARAIHALVATMPEPRQSEIRRRFAAIREALTAEGMLRQIADTPTIPAQAQMELGIRYFRLGLPCPFLEDESCSIHLDRPMACREYLVTSPAALCSDPAAGKIEGVPRPVRLNAAMIVSDPEAPPDRKTWVALSTALDWVERHPPQAPRMPGPDLLRRLLAETFRRDFAGPARAPDGSAMLDSAR